MNAPRATKHALTSALALIATFISTSHSARCQDPLAPSWRVGTSIDSLEREYFGLFPSVDGFRSATAISAGDSVRFTIARTTSDTSMSIARENFDELGRYIDRVEAVLTGAATIDWNRLPRVRGSRQFADGEDVLVTLAGGREVAGRLATAEPSGLTVWTSDDTYDPALIGDHLIAIPTHRIEYLRSGSSFLLGAAAGVATLGGLAAYAHTAGDESAVGVPGLALSVIVGGTIGGTISSLGDVDEPIGGSERLLGQVLPRLRRDRIFFEVAPPELRAHADSAFRAAALVDRPVAIAASNIEELYEQVLAPSRLSLSARFAPTIALASSDYAVEMSFNREADGAVVSSAVAYGADLGFDISPALTITAGLTYRSAFRSDTTTDQEWMSTVEPRAVLELSLDPRRGRRKRTEITIGAGGGLLLVTHTAQLPSGTGGSRRTFETKGTVPMGILRFAVVLNASPVLAFITGLEARIAPSFDVPYYEYASSPNPAFRFKWVPEHSAPLTSAELQFGARFRF